MIPDQLEPGFPRDELVEEFREIGFDAPDSLVELYEWRRGNLEVEVVPGGCFRTLDMGIHTYEDLTPLYKEGRIQPESVFYQINQAIPIFIVVDRPGQFIPFGKSLKSGWKPAFD
ncbi:MAG: hypothetical protein AAF514_11965 [Verrucomicrobiota bacterium]